MTASSVGSLVPLRAEGDLTPLHCVHPVSGSPYCYSAMAHQLSTGNPVFGFESPGFDGMSEPAASITELAELHTAALRAARPHGPYQLLGWSLGGVVAYEMARLLAAEGEEVPLLVIVDAALPGTQAVPPDDQMARFFLYDFLGVTPDRAPGIDKALAGLAPGAQPADIFAAVERDGVVPEEFDAEFLAERFALFSAHVRALGRHHLDAVHPGPAILIKAAESVERLLDWSPYVGRLTVHTAPGDHHSVWQGPGLDAISGIVDRALREANQA
ncbi:thioesterase domain-containing protein [Streptomyces sp. P9(2023)]|uniref:thioesterase domain-containing protein n=1 Tax=Streptomyces sp. P9(2023) TaxID=3064394 RepID=UPI0028F444E4|nr:alpha/beta fold hydrolase [Streptomyces sp. P9(2023)]MDT9687537.1 thioesterase domain-containing protein [Streptomyces sp. P9(2023)]